MRKQGFGFFKYALAVSAMAATGQVWAAFSYPPCADLAATDFRDVKLVQRTDGITEPIKMALDGDAQGNVDVYWIERQGPVKLFSGATKAIKLIGTVPADSKYEAGLTGIALDPNFKSNGWMYFYYAFGDATKYEFRVTRMTYNKTAATLDLASEKILLQIPAGYSKMHTGGAMKFDDNGDLWITVGENAAGVDGAANTNDLRGKILRIHPTPEGSYTIPAGNLFPPGTAKTKPEIYVMGSRNAYTLAIDNVRKAVAWGDIGPDHQADQEEHNYTLKPGFFGWPLFAGKNMPLMGTPNPDAPVVANSGLSPLPPAIGAINSYHQSASITGPIYYYDPQLKSSIKFPPHLNGVWLLSDFDANWMEGAVLNAKADSIIKKERILTTIFGSTIKLPLDIEMGPDGAMYVLMYSGGAWFASDAGTSIHRVEYTGSCTSVAIQMQLNPAILEKEIHVNQRILSIDVPGQHQLDVRDLSGKLVFSRLSPSPAAYATSDIGKPGVYFMTVTTSHGTVSQRIGLGI